MSLYNKMRPTRLSEVRGQSNIVRILKENLAPDGHLPNAMLFVGTRGTGKTTVAKIVAKRLNCESPLEDGACCNECPACRGIMDGNYLDVLELDAASNNGVDNIRDIIEKVQFKPIGKMKVVILDEVHMLSKAAFNALLKIMEEPPSRVLFILCTTELHEIPATILSRCRKFQFNTITPDLIVEKLKDINDLYGIHAEDAALDMVARAAKGSMRDAESIYESFLDAPDGIVTEKMVMDSLGYTSDEIVFMVLDGIIKGDPTISFSALQQTIENGSSLAKLLEECFWILMDVVTIHMGGDITKLSASSVYADRLSDIAFSISTNRLFDIVDSFKEAFEKKIGNLELIFQSMIISLICRQGLMTQLVSKIEILEQEIGSLKQGVTPLCNLENSQVSDEQCSNEEPVRVEPVISNLDEDELDDVDEGLSEADLAELSALGFSMVEEATPFDENGAFPEETSVELTENKDVGAEAAKEAEDYFGDFARLFSSF